MWQKWSKNRSTLSASKFSTRMQRIINYCALRACVHHRGQVGLRTFLSRNKKQIAYVVWFCWLIQRTAYPFRNALWSIFASGSWLPTIPCLHASKYCPVSIFCQSIGVYTTLTARRSRNNRIVLPLPSRKGWRAMLTLRRVPAHEYNVPRKYRCTSRKRLIEKISPSCSKRLKKMLVRVGKEECLGVIQGFLILETEFVLEYPILHASTFRRNAIPRTPVHTVWAFWSLRYFVLPDINLILQF